jgi:pyruvate formate lyase activating enzyme
MKKAFLYKKLLNKKIQCQACSHYCLINDKKRGICGVRENIDGELYALNYGKAVALNIDPIEKKPFFHFLPGTETLSIAAVGCNFRCLNCQNYDLSQSFKNKKEIPGKDLLPQEIVNIAVKNNLSTISYTYTEPNIFLEYALETMKIAQKKKIKNVWVSNGFLSKQSAQLIIPYLEAINIDIKSFSNDFYKKICGGQLEPVLETAQLMKKSNVWLEITTLIIPGFSDSEKTLTKIASFIKEKLNQETPWHITAFSGDVSWKMKQTENTPVDILKKAYQIGKKAGLKYVYTGNVPGLSLENTFCSQCNNLAIERINYSVHRYDNNGFCSKCRTNLNLILK